MDNQWFAGLPSEEPRSKPASYQGQSQRPASLPPRPVTYTPQPEKSAPPTKRQRPPKKELPKPVDKDVSQLATNDVILGFVEKDAGAGREVLLTLARGGDADRAIIPAGTSSINRYKKCEKVLMEVGKIEGSKETGFRIICRPVDL
jgi:hypothetical protein